MDFKRWDDCIHVADAVPEAVASNRRAKFTRLQSRAHVHARVFYGQLSTENLWRLLVKVMLSLSQVPGHG